MARKIQSGSQSIGKKTNEEIGKEVAAMGKLLEKGQYKRVVDRTWDFANDWKVVEISPMATLFWKYAGLAYFHLKDFEGADKCFENAIILMPKDAEAMICRGMTAFAEGNINDAIKNLDNALKIRPDDVKALVLLSLCYGLKGKDAKAQQLARKAATKDRKEAVRMCITAIDTICKSPRIAKQDKVKLVKLKKELNKPIA